jgi:hypothetical protein
MSRSEQQNPRIYAASRASVPERPAMWRKLRDEGVNIVSTWIDEAGPGETASMTELWSQVEREIASCDRLVLYVEPDDFPLKGALVEIGMALGHGKPVYVVASGVRIGTDFRPLGSWLAHPLVTLAGSVRDAVRPDLEGCYHCGTTFRAERWPAHNASCPEVPAAEGTSPEWRVGRKVGRTIYRNDVLAGMMDSPELAAMVVEALNRDGGGLCHIAQKALDREQAATHDSHGQGHEIERLIAELEHMRQQAGPDSCADYAIRNRELEATIREKDAQLAECFRLSGADPDGDEDARLAAHAVAEVRRLRDESDSLEAQSVEAGERE